MAARDRLIQVLTNLLDNTVKFSSHKSTVWLTAQQFETEILLQVKDRALVFRTIA